MDVQPSQLNQIQQAPKQVEVSAKLFAAKYQSKREVYNFLAVDVGVYLPHFDLVTIYFLKDLAHGKKKLILSKDVRHITIPQYEGLALKHISKHLDQSYQHVYDYLPDAQEIQKIPKEWICNVIATIVGEPFFNWVKSVVAERNKTVSKKKGDVITMDAAVANAFFASTKVSLQHGVGANLMKDESKRRRTKKQIKSDEEAKLDEENATRAKIARVDQLEYQLAQAESQAGVNKDASVLLSDLISTGVLKQHAQNQFSAIGPKGEQHFDYDVGAQ